MSVDKLEIAWFLYDIRDAVHTKCRLLEAGDGIIISEPRVPAFAKTNIPDFHPAGDDRDPVCEQAHIEAIKRMRNNRIALRESTFYFPPGVKCRTTPFSPHPTQVLKVFKENTMDFGETDMDDTPVLHTKEWIKFIVAVNQVTDDEIALESTEMDALKNRFGDLGM
jgi:hypothetical protein